MRLALVLCLIALTPAVAGVDPRLSGVTTVFVSGNNEGAYEVRSDLFKARGNKWCIVTAANASTADAVLEVAVPANQRHRPISDEATATLTLRSGDLVWHTSPMFGSSSILRYLNRDVCAAKATYGASVQSGPSESLLPPISAWKSKPAPGLSESTSIKLGTDNRPRVNVATDPAGASVDVDGASAGTTPVSFPLEPGTYKLTLRKSGFASWSMRLKVEPGKPIDVSAELTAEEENDNSRPKPAAAPPAQKQQDDTRVVTLPK